MVNANNARYVLSPTHIHEFKSADRIYTQPPVMSLYLPDQKLGSRSQPGSSSHKFVIKGRQAGSMHRGHTWVFRAETYETMNAWYDDIKTLTEKSGEERNAFVRRHASVRSASAGSARSASSDGGLEEDEADAVPYSANQSLVSQPREQPPTRPSPGGRFPSDLAVNRHLQEPLSPSSGSSDFGPDITTASGGPLQQNAYPTYLANSTSFQPDESIQQSRDAAYANSQPVRQHQDPTYVNFQPNQHQQESSYMNAQPAHQQQYQDSIYSDPYTSNYGTLPNQHQPLRDFPHVNPYTNQSNSPDARLTQGPMIERHDSNYGNWMAPAAGGVAAGALAGEAFRRHQAKEKEQTPQACESEQQYQSNQAGQPQVDQQGVPIDDLTGGTQAQYQHPVDDFTGGTRAQPQHDNLTSGTQASANNGLSGIEPSIPQPYPDHAGSGPTVHPATIITNQSQHGLDSGVATPMPTNKTDSSFLGAAEAAPIAISRQTVNGGPVPVELVETAEKQAFPGVQRTNTDISVSDLHVPGGYPTVPGTPGTSPGTFLSYADRF